MFASTGVLLQKEEGEHDSICISIYGLSGGRLESCSTTIPSTHKSMQRQGWLQDPKTKNTKRFHRDEKSWIRYPKVFIDSGRPLPNEHALLKSRCYVALREAEEEWMKLRMKGWRKVRPQWGADVDV